MSTRGSSSTLGLYLGLVQFFFATTWTLYVIYLPQLAQQAGIGRQWVPWILVGDQILFALADVATGFWVDRMRAGFARLGGWILGVTVISSLAFLALPYLGLGAAPLLGAIALWAVTSSALRSPPWALLARHAAQPSVPSLAAIVLIGSALASAIAPYLGIALRGVDPKLPFLLSTGTLLATVGGLVYAERRVPMESQEAMPSAETHRGAIAFFLALLLMAVGFQIHFSLNSAPRYLQHAPIERLPYLMPVFWIGFSLAMPVASAAVKRFGAIQSMAIAAGIGTLAMYATSLASGLGALVSCEVVAGASWGLASVAAYSAAVGFGRTGREGRFLGTLFAVLALGAFARIAAYASDLVVEPGIKGALPWAPVLAWLSAALLLVVTRSR
jgi:hypothetical protein